MSKTAKTSVRLFQRANQLAKDAQGIADDLFKGRLDKHKIAVLMKQYSELYVEIDR